MNLLFIALAGALGTVCRYLISKQITYLQFPIATLCINSLGSLILGFLFVKYASSNPQLYVTLGIGFCGGFTTYSTFSLDLYKMLITAQYVNFTVYFLGTILLSLFVTFLGAYIAKV